MQLNLATRTVISILMQDKHISICVLEMDYKLQKIKISRNIYFGLWVMTLTHA